MFANYSKGNSIVSGNTGLVITGIIALIMAVMTYTFTPTYPFASQQGVCFESVNKWDMPHWLSWLLNLTALPITALVALHFNKVYQIVHNNTKLYASAFLLLTSTNPWLSGSLSSSILFAIAVQTASMMMFTQYGRHNPNVGLFTSMVLLSTCSMWEYAALLMIPIFMIGAMYLNIFSLKGLAAMILGVICPYWIAIGFGFISLSQISMPNITNIFQSTAEIGFAGFMMLMMVALTALFTLMMSLSNAMKIFATNTRARAFNSFIYLISLTLFWYMLFDFSNLSTYIATFNLMAGIHLSHFFLLNNSWRWTSAASIGVAIYLTLNLITLYG